MWDISIFVGGMLQEHEGWRTPMITGKLARLALLGCPKKLVKGLQMGYNLLLHGEYWGYNPLILTIDPNFRPGTSKYPLNPPRLCVASTGPTSQIVILEWRLNEVLGRVMLNETLTRMLGDWSRIRPVVMMWWMGWCVKDLCWLGITMRINLNV